MTAPSHPSGTLAEYEGKKRAIVVQEEEEQEAEVVKGSKQVSDHGA